MGLIKREGLGQAFCKMGLGLPPGDGAKCSVIAIVVAYVDQLLVGWKRNQFVGDISQRCKCLHKV